MLDELNKIETTKKQNIIMNLQTSKYDGSHWVALFRTDNILKSSKLRTLSVLNYYFDPYGVLPTKEAYNYFRIANILNVEQLFSWNTIQVQQDGTECCGQLSMYFLYQINRTEEKTVDKAVEIILSMKKELEYLQSLA